MTARGNRILIVSDDFDLGQSLERRLSQHAYMIALASSPLELLSQATSSSFDLILCGDERPQSSLFGALRMLRQRMSPENIPIVMLTDVADSTTGIGDPEMSAADYIVKPFEADDLLARVADRLEQAGDLRKPGLDRVDDGLLTLDAAISTARRREDVVSLIVALTSELLGSCACFLLLLDKEARCFLPGGCNGLEHAAEAAFFATQIAVSEAELCRLQEETLAEISARLAMLVQPLVERLPLSNAVVAPVLIGTKLLALLAVGTSASANSFDHDAHVVLQRLAEHAGPALANFEIIGHLPSEEVVDTSTGEYDSHAVMEYLNRQLARARRTRESTALLMIEVDDFGTEAWDSRAPESARVRETIATTIRGSLREADVVARYAKNLFVVCLLGATHDQAWHVAMRVLERVRDDHRSASAQRQCPTVSIGIAASMGVSHAGSLIDSATKALGTAKSAGRDCVR